MAENLVILKLYFSTERAAGPSEGDHTMRRDPDRARLSNQLVA
jgi:hypothetical protein